jgi:ABC-type amino acid transport substrate-binding protein
VDQPVDVFPLFGKNENCFIFKDPDIQRLFDRKFKQLQESGRYQEIIEKYIGTLP